MLDLSGPYRKTFDDILAHATQVADPFHLVKLANTKLDECRRRVQNETLGHRGRKDDPLYRARRLLTKAHERLDERGETKLLGLLAAGDPAARSAWPGTPRKSSARSTTSPTRSSRTSSSTTRRRPSRRSLPTEVRSLGRTLVRWHDQIVAWHDAFVSNGPTEAINNLIKRIKRIGFGFRTSPTTASASCSTPAGPTGTYSPPSHPAEIR